LLLPDAPDKIAEQLRTWSYQEH
ncbi:MAG: hypothetical protein QOC63_284, partial [Mycobacterium sp.]|nr:hypothetical protein [Mycobacterium sp.]